MKVTFILRDLTEAFYEGNGGAIIGINSMPDADKFAHLSKQANGDLRHCVSMKIGNGSFRDKADLNSLVRDGASYTCRLEPRKGYRLATFNVERKTQ